MRHIKKSAVAVAITHCLAGPANAATFTVDSTLDLPSIFTDGNCTLREAIQRAKDDDGVIAGRDCNPVGTVGMDDVIVFDLPLPATIVLSNNSVINSSLKIDEDLEIQGPANGELTLDGNQDSPVFEISNANQTLNPTAEITLSNLTASRGQQLGFAGGLVAGVNTLVTLNSVDFMQNRGAAGGAIRVSANAEVRVFNSTISNNTSTGDAGAILVASGGSLFLQNTTVSDNSSGSRAGAILSDGTVQVYDSQFMANTATAQGGAIYSSNSLLMNGSTVSDNVVTNGAEGGGIRASGAYLSLQNSTISGNVIQGAGNANGGGILGRNLTDVFLLNSEISSNTAGYKGGGLYLFDSTAYLYTVTIANNRLTLGVNEGGGAYFAGQSAYIEGSRFSGNQASHGGGIHAAGSVTLVNSTISGNSASIGGGIFNYFANLTLDRSTVAGNSATSGGGMTLTNENTRLVNSTISSNLNSQSSGGIDNRDGSYLRVYNSTVAYNGGSGNGGIRNYGLVLLSNAILSGNNGQDCSSDESNAVFRDGVNLVESNITCDGGNAFGIAGVPADLSPLQDNGGPTETHGLCEASPAINAASQAACTTNGITLDQRGEQRNDGFCDIGAVEVTLALPINCETSTPFVIPLPGKRAVIIDL